MTGRWEGTGRLDGGRLTRARRIIKTSSHHRLLWNGRAGGGGAAFAGCRFWGFAGGIWREKEGKRSAGLVERIGGIRQELEPLATSALALVSAGPQDKFLAELRDGTLRLRESQRPVI